LRRRRRKSRDREMLRQERDLIIQFARNWERWRKELKETGRVASCDWQ